MESRSYDWEQKAPPPFFRSQRAACHCGDTAMSQPDTSESPTIRPTSWLQIRICNLSLLVFLVAIAIVNIQDQGREEPELIALAAGGFLGYGLGGWLGWLWVRRYEPRLGSAALLVLYLVVMAAFFVFATIVYLVAEYAYVNGHLGRFWRILRVAM
jgi:hypothetical protein